MMQFTKYYKNDALSRYLCIKLDEEQSINTYQLRVLENMNPDFALPVTVHTEEDKQVLNYNVNTKVDLVETLKSTGNLSRKQFETLVQNILEVFLSNKRQQLKPDYFIVHPEYIFFKKNSFNFKLQLVYIPLDGMESDLLQQFKSLIQFLIPLKVNYSDDEFFYKQVLATSNADTFTLNELKEILDNPIHSTNHQNKPKANDDENIVINRAIESKKEKKLESSVQTSMSKTPLKQNMSEVKDYKASYSNERPEQTEKNSEENMVAGLPISKRTLIIALLQLLFVLVTILLWVTLNLVEIKMILGFLIIMLTIDFILVYMVLKKVPASTDTTQKSIKLEESEKPNIEKRRTPEKNIEKNAVPQQSFKPHIEEKTEVLFPLVKEEVEEKTEVLLTRSKLIHLKDDSNITLCPNKKTQIGRNSSNTIVINKKTISGSHAELEYINTEYYIKDLDSKNGTFIDGEKIESHELYLLEDGTIITFADEDYKFQK